ncbi:hypothetical protein RJZ56_007804 [Blastomyces dermatitidis]|uniref:Uncharacterized protein n=2 Tax=Ajellomyces dermatitidis TaxID=5039 RepID=F2TLH1_AJEDA|nr:uncharacterized protein BDCG_16951 [Blastomyces dermatitidis ER-3]EEQ89392.2 hypothetical protein BDCG_16951 [Blastomyces dermatitidis ER-3]EGE84060.1 hypothetical protein BDDG_07005 [Blastomyces dermatitidis ATCC 18188]
MLFFYPILILKEDVSHGLRSVAALAFISVDLIDVVKIRTEADLACTAYDHVPREKSVPRERSVPREGNVSRRAAQTVRKKDCNNNWLAPKEWTHFRKSTAPALSPQQELK